MLLITWIIFLQPINRNILINPQPWQWLNIHPILDLSITAIILNMLLLNSDRVARIAMGLFAIAMIFIMISDIAISTLATNLYPQPINSLDFGVLIAGCCLFIGTLILTRNLSRVPGPYQEEQTWALGLQIQSTLPIALPITLAAILSAYWIQNQIVTQTVIGFSSMVWLLLIARLGVSAGEFELQQYYFLYNNSTEPAFLCDRLHKLILVNPAMIQICKASDESELLNKPLETLLVSKPFQDIKNEIHDETEIRCCDGSTLLVDLSLKPILLGIFKRKLITGAVHDLTVVNQQREELHSANQQLSDVMHKLEEFNQVLEMRVQEKTSSLSSANVELAEKNKKLESLDQMKSDFVSLVSHELRAPLTNISGGMELVLSEKSRLSISNRQSLSLVQQEIRRLTRFVESILDLSALDAGRMPLYPEPLDIGSIIRELQNQFNQVPGSARIKWQFPAIIPPIIADSRAVYSIIFHLMDNALKYAPEGEVIFSVLPEKRRVSFMVQDRGPGVPIDQMDFIFEDFFRGNAANSQTVYGHGLGLYIVNRFLQAMDGSIEVSNRPGGGAEFRCWLPIMDMDHETENSIS